MTKIDKIKEVFKNGLDNATAELAKFESKKAKCNFAYWAEWYCLDYIHWEFSKEIWDQLNKTLAGFIDVKDPIETIVKWIEGCQDEFVQNVLKGSPSHSSNPMANLIENERIEVYRRICSGRFDSGSLASLLIELKRMQ